ncbi:DEHA2A00638p [Debaryomyces hansenii CBS767]|uniref:DEHA2A00638p n=1 Tax=Debaryomyces hansenii (strain ATCC 36239 / CBS 767 / BCRC 21394 / JCM 1990 / NBRC 0083 / IGC 2968) TaxID=284592 RepID=Q6BZK5_DEBHA|nr:DEHA2A00638p [Debaryomyces hansenii CBS767]CAG84309.2 DEHA2A00638p [Debaryomyces hansenii CBS767]|eukprot:XP_456364.2 DEHA2A00638p [Debaryomyces hansenii CBS767]
MSEVVTNSLEKKLSEVLNHELSLNENDQEEERGKTNVERSLKSRHLSMIALGGTIGTGLFISTSVPLNEAGPVNCLIAYIFIASVVYSVAQSLGEMATYIPVAGSFTVFASRFVSPSIGAASGWLYWFCWAIGFAIELSVIGQIIEYWTSAVPNAAWIAIFFVLLTVANLFPVRFYGEIEFWISSIKVITIMGWILYALIMVCGGGKYGAFGFRYWRNPGPWGDGILVDNKNTGRFLGWFSSLINAIFSYQGTELVGVSAGECENPRKTVPSAIKKVFYRIAIFFILSLFFMGLLVPYNDPKLNSETTYIASSPFVIAIQNSGTPVLPDIMNAVILTTIISAGNSDIYIASRTLYALANDKLAPRIFTLTINGIPYYSVLFSSLLGLLGFLSLSAKGLVAFNWLVNISATSGLFAWVFISFSHIRFIKGLKLKGIVRSEELPFVAKGMPIYAWYSVSVITFLIFFQGYEVFVGKFSVAEFFAAYISNIFFVILFVFFQFVWFRNTKFLVPLEEMDIDTGKMPFFDYEMKNETSSGKQKREKLWNIIA